MICRKGRGTLATKRDNQHKSEWILAKTHDKETSMGNSEAKAQLASFGARLLATVIDFAWLIPALIVVDLFLYGPQFFDPAHRTDPGTELVIQVIFGAIIVFMWANYQASPGKLAIRLRIVDASTGGVPSVAKLILRYVGYIISMIPLFLGYFWMLWDDKRQCWHDKMAGTLVVQLPPRDNTVRIGQE
jgi:uncharacterized RDD family membrane protein YckC